MALSEDNRLLDTMSPSMRRFVRLLIGLYMFWGSFAAYGWELTSLSTSDNLSDLLVNTIFKDSTGYMWFGTEVALDRYDGNQIKTYRFPGDARGPRRVNAITELRRGEIFVGNHQGLFVLAPGATSLTQVFPDKISFPVNALADDGNQNLYIGTRQGIFHYDVAKNTIKQTLLRADILAQGNEVTGLWVNPGRGLWTSTYHTLYFLDFSTGKTESYPLPVQGSVMRMTGEGDMLYLATHGSGVVPFDLTCHQFDEPIELGNNIITSLCSDGKGALYVSTDGEGIFKYSLPESRIVAHLTSAPSSPLPIRSNSVYSMVVDDKGLLWIGYYQMGVDYTPHYNDIFEVYAYPGVIDTRQYAVRAVAVEGRQKVIGTREGLFFVDESTGRSAKFVKPEIKSNIIFCITPVGGKYYIGTYNGGMYVLDPVTLKIRQFSADASLLSTESVFAIVTDADGTMWVGASDGLYRFRDDKLLAHYTATNSQLPEGNVYDIFFDSAGRGWMCTENGMAIWTGDALHSDRFPKGFVNAMKIRDVYEDRDHTLYFAPDRGEVFRSNLELTEFGFIPYGVKDPSSMTTFITEDPDGWIWFGTEKGLTRYNKRQNFRHFNNADGLPHLVFTLCPPVRDAEGNLWMGNTQGLLKLDFKKFKTHVADMEQEVSVTDLLTNGQSIFNRLSVTPGNRLIELESNEGDLEVCFANFNYIPAAYHSIEYLLDGYENEWRKTEGTRCIHYYDLPPGKYMLRLRLPGDPSTESVLRIHKKAGLNWPMVTVGLVLLVIGGSVLLVLHSRRRHREELKWVEAQAAEAAVAPVITSVTSDKKNRYKTTRLTDEECKRLIKVLDGIMRTSRPYTNPDLKSSELAAMAGTTGHALSFLFNQYMEKSYYDYVNEYRVAEFKRLVKEVDTSKYTLTAMSQKCGFSSRASFFRHFKNITGITPAEYLRQQH